MATMIPIARLVADSSNREMCSVVKPFRALMSSERIFDKIPGALSLLSNQETYL